MKWVCRRCLTAFSSEDILSQHIDRCQKQQPTNITFSWKDHLKFEDYHMKVPIPIRVYADFERINQPTDNPKVLFKQIPIAVRFYIISPFGNNYNSYFGESCVTSFVNEMLTLENIASNYFESNLPLEITPKKKNHFNNPKCVGFANESYTVILKVLCKKLETTITLQVSTEERPTTNVI